MSSRIRIGNLSKAFGYGTSTIYNLIAEICVLYEDLKLETENLFHAAEDLQHEGEVKKPFEVLYYIRRSTVSLNEYRRALNTLNAEKGFKRTLASFDLKHVRAIEEANRYFQANHKQIKDLRDAFGGHIVPAYARHAIANFAPNEVGKIEWSFDAAHHWALNVDLAMNIIVAGLEHPLGAQGEQALQKFRSVIKMIGEAYLHVQQSSFALTYCFLWDRLG